jgi:hypothetical protein
VSPNLSEFPILCFLHQLCCLSLMQLINSGLMSSSSSNSRRRSRQGAISPTSVKCKYCGRWFRNASGRTKHIGVYHPRGESDLRLAFQPNTSTSSQQTEQSQSDHQSLQTDGPEPEPMDIDTGLIDNCKFYFYRRHLC